MKQRRRIFLRFGLRSILTVTTIVALFCGVWLRQAMVQRDVSQKLERIGVDLSMGEVPTWLSWLPKSVLNYEGGHYFCPVTAATAGCANVRREGPPVLPLLAKLPSLKSLRIGKVALRGETLKGLADFAKLEELILLDGSFNNDDIAAIPRLTRLKYLDLSRNTECSILPIGLSNLRVLNLDATAFSDEGMQQLAKSNKLESLSLSYTRVSDQGMDKLSPLQRLAVLDLACTSVTGEHLSSLRSLRSLSLGDTALSEHHFIEICKLPMLTSLNVQDCRKITEVGLQGLSGSRILENLDLTVDRSTITSNSITTSK
ncbi:MAG: hypothetical protein SFV81_10010 [Pirellulaceae bacterium]|nr:hypothetical protein [Pirellulaceae bacterium]